jgi:NADH-quinone oxidoreductase subunit J
MMDVSPLFFYAFAGLAIACSAMVILKKNPVASAFNLVVVFFAFAGIYGMLGAHLVAALQILVYAGAIMVLFVFVIMLLNSDVPSFDLGRTHSGLKFVGAIASLALFLLFIRAFQTSGAPAIPGAATPQAIEAAGGNTKVLSEMMFSEYILPFELTSVLLLGAIVGAVAIAKRKPPAGAQAYGTSASARRAS